MTRLIIWRHGRTEWNALGRVQGWADPDLDDTGVAQAERVAPRLVECGPDAIFSSDLRRARHTAEALAVLTGQSVQVDQRLRERDYGPWEGLTHPEIRERYPDDYARWGTPLPIANPEIESREDMAKRVVTALEEIADRMAGGTAVVVTHGGAARAGCGAMLGWAPQTWRSLGVLGNCRFSELRHVAGRGWQLRAHNLT